MQQGIVEAMQITSPAAGHRPYPQPQHNPCYPTIGNGKQKSSQISKCLSCPQNLILEVNKLTTKHLREAAGDLEVDKDRKLLTRGLSTLGYHEA